MCYHRHTCKKSPWGARGDFTLEEAAGGKADVSDDYFGWLGDSGNIDTMEKEDGDWWRIWNKEYTLGRRLTYVAIVKSTTRKVLSTNSL